MHKVTKVGDYHRKVRGLHSYVRVCLWRRDKKQLVGIEDKQRCQMHLVHVFLWPVTSTFKGTFRLDAQIDKAVCMEMCTPVTHCHTFCGTLPLSVLCFTEPLFPINTFKRAISHTVAPSGADKWIIGRSPILPWHICLSNLPFLCSPQSFTLIIHLTPILKGKMDPFLFFCIKVRIKRVKRKPALVGITSMWIPIMLNRWSSGPVSAVQVKNHIKGWDRNNQNTSFLYHSAFLLAANTFSLFSASFFQPLVRSFPAGCIFPYLTLLFGSHFLITVLMQNTF